MFPLIKNASPPNIFFSVTSGSPLSCSRIRSASTSSYATAGFYGCALSPVTCVDARWSGQGEPGLEPQVVAVPFGGLFEGFDVAWPQGAVGPQVELDVVVGDVTSHCGDNLCIH